jgi:DNA-binding beta-propeller fold protein YncE
VHAGCEPVSVVAAPNGRQVWVAALGDHAVLAFDAHKLVTNPGSALRALVHLGPSPSSLLSLANGGRLLVGDVSTKGGVAVIDAIAATHHRPALMGQVRPGTGASGLALDPRGRGVVVADTGYPNIELIRAERVP